MQISNPRSYIKFKVHIEIIENTELKFVKNSVHICSDAQIYLDLPSYITNIIAVQIFFTENTVILNTKDL